MPNDDSLVTDQCSVSYMTPWATVSHPNPKHSVALLEESARICRLSHPNVSRIVAVSHLSFAVLRPAVAVSHPNPKHSVALLEESARICRLSHPNVSRIVAVSHLSFAVLRPAVAVEWPAGGTLAEYFQHQIRDQEERERPTILLKDMLEILLQVSAALKHFHEVLGDVAHGAVTTQNVQLTTKDLRRCVVKLSCLYPPTTSRLPPEIVCSTERNPKYRQEGDIWMFGILCWESMTLGAEPHYQRTTEEIQRMFGILCWESMTLGAEPHYQRTTEEIQR
ncbi:unnamed protein product [Strongylus vulgaris]|uniref:Protein kinase domain-containing protein n=1 Tax=Strongylus vulgaris TaxID=40348 RepID=A0A3P7L4D2_STRVU|nr:unnamed protein product [Strongylus vulgaris]